MKATEPANLLVVGDVADTIQAVEESLADLGQHLIKAKSGREALRWALRDDFAVIVLDTRISDVTAFETAARIRRRRRAELTPIIFITDENSAAESFVDAISGAVDYVTLPLDPQLLRSKVGVLVDLFHKTETIRHQAAHRVQLAREQAARQVAEKAMRRSALLAEASRILSRSLDFDATLVSLHRAVAPALADACQLVLYDQDGDLWYAPVGEQNGDGQDPATGSSSRIQTVDQRLAEAIRRAIASCHALPLPEEIVQSAPNLRREKPWSSVVVAPLIARDIPIGAIVCCRRSVRQPFAPQDVALLEDLAGRAATALDNAQLYQTIREGERRKDEFLAMLGHELRNPLAAITNAGELTRLLSPQDRAFPETLEIIRQQASLMKRLVDDLLDVSRITSGRVQLQKTPVRADEILARAAEATNPLFTARGHSLKLAIADKNITLEADPFRLEQILSNLMVNAAKYTDPGGKISLSVTRDAGDVVFSVKDNGIGIGPDLLPNVFDLFSQANRSLHRAEGGLGIGLTIVKGLAELHGGRVVALSDGIGRGSEFVVRLPAATASLFKRPAAKPIEPALADHRRRILVVEDQPALLHVTVQLLRKLGHEVRSAADGPEALLAVKEYHPEVVFLDIGLPGMDGYEVAQYLRAEMGDTAPMLVAMTGYGQHEVNRHSQKARFDHHLVKPADISAMRSLLAQVD